MEKLSDAEVAQQKNLGIPPACDNQWTESAEILNSLHILQKLLASFLCWSRSFGKLEYQQLQEVSSRMRVQNW